MIENFPSEKEKMEDSETGRTVIRWTQSKARNNHLYFTSPSVTEDDRWLIFLSERTGRVNVFAIDRETGQGHRISKNDRGILRSYCWPWGGRLGLSKASSILDSQRGRVFYIQDQAVWASDVADPDPEKLWDLPVGWISNFTHVSPDGKRLCVPLGDPRAFPDGMRSQGEQLKVVPHLMQQMDLCSRIYLVELETGEATVAAEVPFWVSHVQFDPSGTGRIIFNREGVRLQNRPRTWCLEPGGEFRPLYDQPNGEFASHENWSEDGEMIVYHGGRDGKGFFAARKWGGDLLFEVEVPRGTCGHVTPTRDGRGFITDSVDGNIKLMRLAGNDDVENHVLCQHNSDMSGVMDQDDHVHALVTPRGDSAIFSSNRSGVADVYEVKIGDLVD